MVSDTTRFKRLKQLMSRKTITYSLLCMALMLSLAMTSCNHSRTDKAEAAQIQFEDTILDLGQFPLTEHKEFSFKFTNTGTSGLVIEGVEPGCVCTEVSFPSDTIPAGKGGEIHVFFNGEGRFLNGPHDFYIHVKSNTKPKYTDLLFTTDFI